MSRRFAVCIITFERPEGLGKLLAHLKTQERRPEDLLHVVVIDNNPDRSAAPVVESARASGLEIAYAHEPVPGIPRARNRSVELALASGATWLCFIDDDETPADDWLTRLAAHAAASGAPLVTGPVIPVLPAEAPPWLATSNLFNVRRYPTGTRRDRAYTGNVLVHSSVFESMDRWFDESMSLTGGSDTEFFKRVNAAGFIIQWCDEAIAFEDVPAERCRLGWIARRNFRLGLGFARFAYGFGNVAALGKVLALGAYRVAKGLVVAVATLCLSATARLRSVESLASGTGLLLGAFGLTIDEYKRPSAPTLPPSAESAVGGTGES